MCKNIFYRKIYVAPGFLVCTHLMTSVYTGTHAQLRVTATISGIKFAAADRYV